MRRDKLKKQQPVVYQALYNALKGNRSANAYLFAGPPSPMKEEAAVLLAESLLCMEKDDVFACETCSLCKRVEENIHPDVIVLNGKEKSVSKNDVDEIQSRFSKTALEKGTGRKVYIILNLENASLAAMNSLLKFLEEPAEGVTAVLTTDNINRILPTILSRSTILTFRPPGKETYLEEAKAQGISREDTRFLMHVCSDPLRMQEYAEKETYEKAKKMFRQFLNLDGMKDELLIDYDISWKFKEKDKNLELLGMFFDLLSMYAHDAIVYDESGPAWYDDAVKRSGLSYQECADMIRIVNEQKDKCNKYNDLSLVLCQTINRLEG